VNEDTMGVDEPLAGDELDQVMARYARVRLDPSPAQVRRARSALMADAWRQHLAASGSPAPAARHRRPFTGWSGRRLGATFAAAVMAGLLVGSSVFAASRAGGPLYGVRMEAERLALPGDPGARLEAEIAIAQTRLAEVVDASSRGDQTAFDASLAGYEAAIADFGGATGSSAERALEAITAHRMVLAAVLGRAPAAATDGLNTAISQSDRLIERLDEAMSAGGGTPGAGSGMPGAGTDDNGGPGAGTGPAVDRTPKPGTGPAVDRTPKPAKTAAPDATPKSAAPATPKPGKTPKPRPTQTSPSDPPSGG
jgi:sRNA-binding protein